MIRLILVLTLITLVAALALGFVYQSAAPKIEEQRKIADELARRVALPGAACGIFVEVSTEGFSYYEGYRRPDTTDFVGYVVKAEGKGYSSTIETVVGVDPSGRITGLRITQQQETPGLGTRIVEVKSTKTVLDAIEEMVGRGVPETVPVEVALPDQTMRCLEVELRNHQLCGQMEECLARQDTVQVVALARRAFGLSPQDSLAVLVDPALTFHLCQRVMEELRSGATPWFLKQFVGKRHTSLLVTKQPTDKYIQAITGATISSVAVTESVRDALERLEKAVGGFQETSQ
jgi:electron transport complex protein RnfG